MFKLLRYFSITSLIACIIVIIVLAKLYNDKAIDDLMVLGERHNVALTYAFANTTWSQFRPFMALASELSPDELRAHSKTAELYQILLAQMERQSIIKVKVYDLQGKTIFSTEATQIGENKRDSPGFLAARSGRVLSELTHRNQINDFDNVIESRDILSSYVPVYADEGQIDGIFEVYSDVTSLLTHIQQTQRDIIISVTIILGILYIFLVLLVRWADNIIHQQSLELIHARNVAESANLAKSQFLFFITHELKTPLTIIKGYADLLLGKWEKINEDRQMEYIKVIRDSADRMAILADDLLDISRIETNSLNLELRNVSIVDILDEVARSVQRQIDEKEQKLTFNMPPNLAEVKGDYTRLVQVFSNLITNANKYTPSGGEIVITVEPITDEDIVKILVMDTGIGLSEEDQKRVFQRFFRSEDEEARRSPGTGLGLHITRNLVELQGGQIGFESKFREGTTFYVTIPLA